MNNIEVEKSRNFEVEKSRNFYFFCEGVKEVCP